MKQFILFCLLCVSLSSMAQVDYLEYRERVRLSCGSPDSATVLRNQVLIDSLSVSEISNGGKEFLYDRGWVYYRRYTLWKNIRDMEISTQSFLNAWEEYQHLTALWNLGSNYRLLDDCTKSIEYTELYLQELPEDERTDYQQIYYRYKYCRGKN